jgi:hypothetical protein
MKLHSQLMIALIIFGSIEKFLNNSYPQTREI